MRAALRILSFAVLFLAAPLEAHDHWINHMGFKSPKNGAHCCGVHKNDQGELEGDCHRLKPSQLEDRGATIYMKPPFDEVWKREDAYPSEDGYPWWCGQVSGLDNRPFVRCLFYPTGGV